MKFSFLAATSLVAFSCASCIAQPADTAKTPAEKPAVTAPLPLKEVSITVEPGVRQPLLGFGFGINYGTGGRYKQLSPQRQQTLNQMMWRDTGFNTARFWFHLKRYAPEMGTRNLEGAIGLDINLIKDAQNYGLKTLVLAPTSVPDYLYEKREIEVKGKMVERNMFKAGALKQHAAIIADFIKEVRDTHGVQIEATGVQNEPNTIPAFTPEIIVEAVKELRAALDARGLASVEIFAPETASTDGVAYKMVEALKADETAWNAMSGIATHSYNMGATEKMANYIAKDGPALAADRLGTNTKEYWQTESSTPGPEVAGDAENATIGAATFLSDMNRRMTHWIYFIGAMQEDKRDNGTRLVAYDAAETGENWLKPNLKYYYFKQLGQTFDIGALFRTADSSLDKSMTWTYGRKPRVTLAAARNPDGSWGIGVTNYTKTPAAPYKKGFQEQNAPHEAQPFEVTIQIPELAGAGDKQFVVHRSGPQGEGLLQFAQEKAVTMKNGAVTVTVEPMQLVTLRSK